MDFLRPIAGREVTMGKLFTTMLGREMELKVKRKERISFIRAIVALVIALCNSSTEANTEGVCSHIVPHTEYKMPLCQYAYFVVKQRLLAVNGSVNGRGLYALPLHPSTVWANDFLLVLFVQWLLVWQEMKATWNVIQTFIVACWQKINFADGEI